MKKLFLLVFVLFFISCASTSIDAMAVKPLYSVVHGNYENLDGELQIEKLIIYNARNELFTNEIITIDKFIYNNKTTLYGFEISYLGQDWLFIDNLELKIDDERLSLHDEKPTRYVDSPNVYEIAKFILDEKQYNLLKNSTELSMQYRSFIIKVPPKGMEKIHEFLD